MYKKILKDNNGHGHTVVIIFSLYCHIVAPLCRYLGLSEERSIKNSSIIYNVWAEGVYLTCCNRGFTVGALDVWTGCFLSAECCFKVWWGLHVYFNRKTWDGFSPNWTQSSPQCRCLVQMKKRANRFLISQFNVDIQQLLQWMDKCSFTLKLSTVKECKYLKPQACFLLCLKQAKQESGIDHFKMYP